MSTPNTKVVFDKTINLGHILTFIGFIAAIATMYMNVNTRITMLEQYVTYQAKKDETQDAAVKEGKNEIKEALKDVHTSLDKLADRVDKLRENRK